MKKQLENDLQQLQSERELFAMRAKIYKEAGLEKKAEEFLSVVEKDEILIKAYKKELENL